MTASDRSGTLDPTSRAVAVAGLLNRIGTWGLDPDIRRQTLDERTMDLNDQAADPSFGAKSIILGRALRTFGSDFRYRITGDNQSAIPVALVFALIASGAFGYAFAREPELHTVSHLLSGSGLLLISALFLYSPRAIRATGACLGSLVIAIGCTLGAASVPVYEETLVFDTATQIALGAIGVAFAAIAVGLRFARRKRVLEAAGLVVILGTALLAFGELGWAIHVAGEKNLEAIAAGAIAVGAIPGLSFFVRLRHLPLI